MGEEKEYFLYGVADCKAASQWSGRRPSGGTTRGQGDGEDPASEELGTQANVAGHLVPALRLSSPRVEPHLPGENWTGRGEVASQAQKYFGNE